jgi:RNA polymerase sigma-70 factor (ECF subfamily)
MSADRFIVTPAAPDRPIAAPAAIGYGRRPSVLAARLVSATPGPDAIRGTGVSRRNGVAPADGPSDREQVLRDDALMQRIADGDRGAFAVVVGELSPRLLRFCRSVLTANPAEAEEVVQEALLRLWQQAGRWQPNGRISTWLHQVAYRLSIDSIRRRRPSVAIDSVEDDLEDGEAAPDVRLMRIETVGAVRAAIGRLPDRQRAALLLCHFQEMSQIDAAAVMELGESAYESLLARARRRLRILLSNANEKDKGGVS